MIERLSTMQGSSISKMPRLDFVPLTPKICADSYHQAFFVDRWGRRTFLLIGSCGCVSALIFLCALTATFLGTNNTAGLNATGE